MLIATVWPTLTHISVVTFILASLAFMRKSWKTCHTKYFNCSIKTRPLRHPQYASKCLIFDGFYCTIAWALSTPFCTPSLGTEHTTHLSSMFQPSRGLLQDQPWEGQNIDDPFFWISVCSIHGAHTDPEKVSRRPNVDDKKLSLIPKLLLYNKTHQKLDTE